MKRAQIEMMGLFAIIVVLSIVFLISLTLLLRPDRGYEAPYLSIEANSLLTAILRTDIDDTGDRKLRNIIIDCEDGDSDACGQRDVILGQILDSTLKNKKYNLVIISGGVETKSFPDDTSNCNRKSRNLITSKVKIRPTNPISIQLFLCLQ